jgi:hypothetical protein
MVVLSKANAKGRAKQKVYESEKGGELSAEMQDAIKQAKDGDKIFFEHIICTDKNDSLYAGAPVALKLMVFPPVPAPEKAPGNNEVNADTSQTH